MFRLVRLLGPSKMRNLCRIDKVWGLGNLSCFRQNQANDLQITSLFANSVASAFSGRLRELLVFRFIKLVFLIRIR